MGDASNSPLVKMGMIRGKAAGKAIASVSNGFSLQMRGNGALMFSCVNFLSRRGMIENGEVGVALGRSARALSRIIIVNCNDVRHGSMADSVAAMGTRSVGINIVAAPTRVLRNGIPKLAVTGADSPGNSTSVSLHNTSSLHANRTVRPCCMMSKMPKMDVSLMTPRSVRDVSILHSTSTATVCNSGTTGNIVVVAAGGKGGSKHADMDCDNCMT